MLGCNDDWADDVFYYKNKLDSEITTYIKYYQILQTEWESVIRSRQNG